jgi:hypothetical protein
MEIQYIEIDKLTPCDNPRFISEKNLKRLVDSIQQDPEFLQQRPLLVNHLNGQYIVYGGNQRLLACKALKYEKIPCLVDTIDEQKMRARMLKDNINYGEWDFDKLLDDFELEELEKFSVSETFLEEFENLFESSNKKEKRSRKKVNKFTKTFEEKYGKDIDNNIDNHNNPNTLTDNASDDELIEEQLEQQFGVKQETQNPHHPVGANGDAFIPLQYADDNVASTDPDVLKNIAPLRVNKMKNIMIPVKVENYDYLASMIKEIQDEINAPDWEAVLRYFIEIHYKQYQKV